MTLRPAPAGLGGGCGAHLLAGHPAAETRVVLVLSRLDRDRCAEWSRPPTTPVPVYAARTTLPAGTTLSGDIAQRRQVRLGESAAVLRRGRRPAVGRVLLRPVAAGELVPRSAVGPGFGAAAPSVSIPRGAPCPRASPRWEAGRRLGLSPGAGAGRRRELQAAAAAGLRRGGLPGHHPRGGALAGRHDHGRCCSASRARHGPRRDRERGPHGGARAPGRRRRPAGASADDAGGPRRGHRCMGPRW